jgi:putative transposase
MPSTITIGISDMVIFFKTDIKGIPLGSRSELVGGGLIRSLGGWSTVLSLRRHGDRALSDERILGNGAFVEQILKEADDLVKRQFPENRQQK